MNKQSVTTAIVLVVLLIAAATGQSGRTEADANSPTLNQRQSGPTSISRMAGVIENLELRIERLEARAALSDATIIENAPQLELTQAEMEIDANAKVLQLLRVELVANNPEDFERLQELEVERNALERTVDQMMHREDTTAEVEGDEHPPQEKRQPGVQLVEPHGHAGAGAGPSQADDVLRSDIGGEDRGSDDEPARVPAGQEIVLRGLLLLPEHPPRHPREDREVGPDGEPIEGLKSHIPKSTLMPCSNTMSRGIPMASSRSKSAWRSGGSTPFSVMRSSTPS